MKDVSGPFAFLLVFLVGRACCAGPSSGYCIDSQCFTVFRQPSSFRAAQDACADRGGHLMTVRSSVSHDILFILLANLTENFWIGLHLLAGCPDSPDALRGFQWVTKDAESDFSNWPPSFDSGCSAPRCVTVSQQSDFKWTQEPCAQKAAGFLCEHAFSNQCARLALLPGESATYTTPLGFGGEDLLSLMPGSTAVRMPSETKYVCFSEQWLQAPWTCEISEGGCEYKCAVDPSNTPSCYCPPGQSLNPDNLVTCEDQVTDDPCVALRCAQVCYEEEAGRYACTCDHGFQLAEDGRTCVDFNDCRDERQCPGDNFIGELCVDTDECAQAPCEHECVNTHGSYECACFPGYRVSPESPDKCELYCGKPECPAECDPNDRFQCYCPGGYISEERGHDVFCIDMDECSFFFCDQGCVNTYGSYQCSCNPGYTLVDGFKCVRSDDEDADGGPEGSGMTTDPIITPTPRVVVPQPGPTRRPSGVSTGALVGIIACTALFVVLLVFAVYHLPLTDQLTHRSSPSDRLQRTATFYF
uniref:Thrombomodulin n=1 Tax=Salarias fasciatus TaxID=181472 RepID=A0A672HQ40_SALFA